MALVAAGARVLAEMKADPMKELASRIERLEQAEKGTLLSAMEEARSRFASLKGEYIVSEQPITADAGCGCCPACTSMCQGSCCANCSYGADSVQPLLVDVLQKLMSDVVSFYFRSHGYHWNVKGSDFSEYHELFGEIYEDVYGSIDPLAENIVKLGFEAPFSFNDFESLRSIGDSTVQSYGAIGLAYDLHEANDVLLAELKAAFDASTAANEQGVANFLADRIDNHMKWAWQLKASLVPDDLEMPENPQDEEFFVTVFSTLEERGLVAAGPSEEVRAELAKKGFALPDGSYPIRSVGDLKKAIQSYGRAKESDRAKVRRHIAKRARALKHPELIPDEWKSLSTNGMELSIAVADLRSRISSTSLTAAGGADEAPVEPVVEGEGGVDPKAPASNEVVDANKVHQLTAQTQPRDAQGRFRLVLARLKQDLGTASLDSVAKQVAEVENLDNAGNYAEAAKAASDVIGVVNRIDTEALSATNLSSIRLGTTALAKAISNLPLPFADQSEKIRFSDVPPALADLMKDMMDKVEKKIGADDAKAANEKLSSFISGSDVFSQGEISSEMNKLLRLLT
jgi:starvation-inducible DNA-binding protein